MKTLTSSSIFLILAAILFLTMLIASFDKKHVITDVIEDQVIIEEVHWHEDNLCIWTFRDTVVTYDTIQITF